MLSFMQKLLHVRFMNETCCRHKRLEKTELRLSGTSRLRSASFTFQLRPNEHTQRPRPAGDCSGDPVGPGRPPDHRRQTGLMRAARLWDSCIILLTSARFGLNIDDMDPTSTNRLSLTDRRRSCCCFNSKDESSLCENRATRRVHICLQQTPLKSTG